MHSRTRACKSELNDFTGSQLLIPASARTSKTRTTASDKSNSLNVSAVYRH
jgi:hypothetical protein